MNRDLSAPRDFAALKALIAARAPAMPKRLAQIASFALDNPDEIAFGTVASIAARTRSRTAGDTRSGVRNARDTVMVPTPARRADHTPRHRPTLP